MKGKISALIAGMIIMITGCKTTDMENTSKTYSVTKQVQKIMNGSNEIFGEIYIPEGEGPFPVIIASHGYNGHYSDFAADLYYYAQNGFITYGYDFCGGSVSSRSSMKTTEMTIFTEKSDLIAVYEYFAERNDTDKDNIFLLGGSQGGLVTALAANELKDKIKGIYLYFPALCVADNWRDNGKADPSIYTADDKDFWGMRLGREFFTSIKDFYVFDNIADFPNNVFIIHGTNDVIVPFSYSEKAKRIYGKKCTLIALSGEGHGFSPSGNATARVYMHKFLKANLK